ncbi:hypothetical protein V2J83_24790 [Pseudomonas alliivorans]|nr:hypothetical protein [Pseudomonas alliivorans]
MTTKPNIGTVSVSRELLERMRQRLIELNQIGDFGPELFELLNRNHQPADQQGEPVAWMAMNRHGYPDKCLPSDPEGFPVYRHAQPATAKVVLPRRLSQDDGFSCEAAEWFNACLDEVARLNGIET